MKQVVGNARLLNQKPFKDAPEVPIDYRDIPLPEHHHRGYAWLIEALTTVKAVPYGVSNIFSIL